MIVSAQSTRAHAALEPGGWEGDSHLSRARPLLAMGLVSTMLLLAGLSALGYSPRRWRIPESPDAPIQAVYALVEARQETQAIHRLELYLERAPEDVSARRLLALLLGQEGQLSRAVREARRVLELQPEAAWTLSALVDPRQLLTRTDHAAALEDLVQLEAMFPSHPDCLRAAAVHSLALGQVERALAALEALPPPDPTLAPILARLLEAARTDHAHARTQALVRAHGP